MPADPYTWTPLHDLALIYLALTHGADADLDPAEVEAMAVKLNDWDAQTQLPHIREVMDQVMLVYVGEAGQAMLEMAVVSVRASMPKMKRIAVLNDLAEIASADGTIASGEISFIQELARRWEVDHELR